MKEIKVYHSLSKNLLLLVVCFVFVALGISTIANPPKDISTFGIVISWTGVLFFGGGALFMLYLILRERLTGQAYYVITDQSLIMHTPKRYEVRFVDVEAFRLTKVTSNQMITIHYKPNVEVQKFEDASILGRLTRCFNERMAGAQEGLPANGLSIKAQELCDLLNERVKKA